MFYFHYIRAARSLHVHEVTQNGIGSTNCLEYFHFEMFISAAFYLYLMFTPAAIFLTEKKDNHIFYNASNFLPLFVNHLGLLVFASNLKYLGSTK